MTIEKLEALEPIFGSWYVDSKLAEGRNSKVYKMYKTVDGITKFQALKTVRFPSGDKELSRVIESGKYKTINEYLDLLEKAVTENMNMMLSLRTNPHIVRYDNFKIIREKSCFYVIMLMELLAPFSDYVKADSVTKEQVVKISTDLCYAAEGFRSAGIMHHQIKPENIYVDGKGNFKLGDFGISNVSDRIKTEASPYMAPEIYNKSEYDTSSDIYSIGVLMYKLLNKNRLPFLPAFPKPVSLNDREIAFEKQMRGAVLSAPVNSDHEMTAIISKALAHNQADRYYSPLLMRTELERYLENLNAPSSLQIQPVPVFITTPPPVVNTTPVNKPDAADSNDIRFASYAQQKAPEFSVTDTEKAAFKAAFTEDDDDIEDDDKSDNKKLYIIVGAIIAVIAVIIAILASGFSDEKDTSGATVSTASPPTVVITQPPTVAPSTAPIVTTETTTETESTSETTSENESTTEAITEPSTETTTETTTESTTEATTEPTTASAPVSVEKPILVTYNHDNGDKAEDGRVYTEIEDYTIIETPENEFFDQVTIEITTPLGENIISDGPAYIYEMSGKTVFQKIPAELICIESEGDEKSVACYISVSDEDFYYSPDFFQYYICLEEGAIESDSVISLPLQIEI